MPKTLAVTEPTSLSTGYVGSFTIDLVARFSLTFGWIWYKSLCKTTPPGSVFVSLHGLGYDLRNDMRHTLAQRLVYSNACAFSGKFSCVLGEVQCLRSISC